MTTDQIATIYSELPKEQQEKFIAFLNRLLSKAQGDRQPLPSVSDLVDC